MRITLGRGTNRKQIVIPTGSNVGVTREHVGDMSVLLQQSGVKLSGSMSGIR